MAIREVKVLDQTEIKAWRDNKPDDAERVTGPRFMSWGGRDDPTDPLDDPDAYEGTTAIVEMDDPDPTPSIRVLRDSYLQRLLDWYRRDTDGALALERAKVLRQMSPLQFSHLTDDQLAEMLSDHLVHEIARMKAERAVANFAQKTGLWDEVELSWVGSGEEQKPIYLPGQVGRREGA